MAAGVDADETVLYINLEEPTEQIRDNAASLGFDLRRNREGCWRPQKRVGTYERTLRSHEITGYGVVVGDPLSNVDGLLSESPTLNSRLPANE